MAFQSTYYTGDPKKYIEGKEKWKNLPSVDADKLTDPEHYLASPELAAAVNVALELGMPLLVTGDPGCGKSRLADSIAWELGFQGGEALRFVVSSDTVKRDLFYEFDAVGRFHAASNNMDNIAAHHFIKYNALGLAILRANGKKPEYKDLMREKDWNELKKGIRSVVLIDEIDKAPREVPNDLLTQLENLSFSVPELQYEKDIALDKDQQHNRPIIIITSNAERDLPPAFLRRCIYFHIDLPPFQASVESIKTDPPPVTIERIVTERLGDRFSGRDLLLKEALELFKHFHDSRLAQKPSLAELLAWMLYLGNPSNSNIQSLRKHPNLKQSLGILIKPHNDYERSLRDQLFKEWL